VHFANNFPFIQSHSNISADILSLNPNVDYSNPENIKLIEEATHTFLENNISSYLYKTSKEFRSDIAGFGRYARRHYWTIEEWRNSDWLNNYENSFFDVRVDVTVKGSHLFNRL